jgi:hypothetical protein
MIKNSTMHEILIRRDPGHEVFSFIGRKKLTTIITYQKYEKGIAFGQINTGL